MIQKTLEIGRLPRAVREDLYGMHAMFNDPDAVERVFYRKRVPVRAIDLTILADRQLYPMDAESIAEYANLVLNEPTLKYAVIADGRLLDGLHRITSRVRRGLTSMEAVDFTGLINTNLSGYSAEICVIANPELNTSKESSPSPC